MEIYKTGEKVDFGLFNICVCSIHKKLTEKNAYYLEFTFPDKVKYYPNRNDKYEIECIKYILKLNNNNSSIEIKNNKETEDFLIKNIRCYLDEIRNDILENINKESLTIDNKATKKFKRLEELVKFTSTKNLLEKMMNIKDFDKQMEYMQSKVITIID